MSNRNQPQYLQDSFDTDDDALLLAGNAGYIEIAPDPAPGAALYTAYPSSENYFNNAKEVRPETDAEMAARLQREELYNVNTSQVPAAPYGAPPSAVQDQPIRAGHAVCSAFFTAGVTAAFAAACVYGPMITTAMLFTDTNGQLPETTNGTIVASGIWFTETCPTTATVDDWVAALTPGNNGDTPCTVAAVECPALLGAVDTCYQDQGWCNAAKVFSLCGTGLGALAVIMTLMAIKLRAAARVARSSLALAAVFATLIAGYYGAVFGGCAVQGVPGTVVLAELGNGFFFTLLVALGLVGAAVVTPTGRYTTRGTGVAALTFCIFCLFLTWLIL